MEQNFQIYLNKRIKNNDREGDKKNAFLVEGGGTRGVFAIGILQYLFEENKSYRLQDTDIYGGTSVGSYLAVALSLGFTKDDMSAISKIIDISHLIDSKWLFMLTTYRFIHEGHLYDNSGREKIIEQILNYKIDDINKHLNFPDGSKVTGKELTFGHLKTLIAKYPNVYKHLLVNTVDINRGEQIFITTLDDRWDEIKLIDGLMASSAIPFVFSTINIYYYPELDKYGYIPMDGCLKCQWIDGGVSTNNTTDFFLVKDSKYNDYNLWLLTFTTEPSYVELNGNIAMLKQLTDYLISGKNDVKMELVKEEYHISTINLHSKAGTLDLYTPLQVQTIIADIYNQCVDGKIYFGN